MRDDDAADIRALLHAEADQAPHPAGMTRVNLRRARVQRTAVTFASVFAILVVLAGVGIAAAWVAGDRDPINPASGGWVAIADVEELQDEGVIYDPSHRAFAVWNEGEPLVLSAVVPHFPGERALFCTSSQTFDGPHGERFDVRGYYYGGPAQRGLDRYETRVVDGVVQFDPSRLNEGPPRGGGAELDRSARFCAEDDVERAPGFAAVTTGNPALDSDFTFEPYPGSQWFGPQGPVDPDDGTINVIRGPEQCGWETAALLHVSWPLGSTHRDDPELRQYVRDPDAVLPQDQLMSTYDPSRQLWGGFEYSGYRTDFMEVWIQSFDEDGDADGAFLMFANHVEWWPRAEEPIACS